MTLSDDRRAPRTATDSALSGDGAPLVASLPPVYRYLILLNLVLVVVSLALTVLARDPVAAQGGDPVRPSVSTCLTSATQANRDAMPQVPARPQQPADRTLTFPAAAVLGCRVQLI